MANKAALLIGINYVGTDFPLQGCWNDVINMKNYLISKGYLEENIEVMTDQPQFEGTQFFPRRDHIINAMNRFINKSQQNYSELFLHYSGHGGFLRDRNGEELDGRDECIFPVDLNMIADDELRMILVDRLPANIKLRCVFDCCNSGTGIDLNYRYVPFVGTYRENRGVEGKDVISVSGSRDDQYSYDAVIDNVPQGALTATLLKLLKNPPIANWKWYDFIKILQYQIQTDGFPQIPQLSLCNHPDVTKVVDI